MSLRLLPAATKLWPRLCFYTCVWFCSQRGGVSGQGEPPQQGEPPWGPPARETPWAPLGRENTPPTGRPPTRSRPPQSKPPPPPHQTPPREAHSSIRSTSGRYASYWNAFLYCLDFLIHQVSHSKMCFNTNKSIWHKRWGKLQINHWRLGSAPTPRPAEAVNAG